MLKSICCDTPNRRVRVGWLSFQPRDGAISFGLSDKAYAPQLLGAQVNNPHLTWHPPIYFHFKGHTQASKDAYFQGIADIPIVLQQQPEQKWITARTRPLADLKGAGQLNGRFKSEELVIKVPTENASVQISVDFVRCGAWKGVGHASLWYIDWRDIGIRLTASFTFPTSPMIAWVHYS
jgi:hypothetical protein